jgi:hypothetical protein
MTAPHQIIQLAFAYAFVGAVVLTLLVACLCRAEWIKLADRGQQTKLYYLLLAEAVVLAMGFFGQVLRFDPAELARNIVQYDREERALDQVERLFRLSTLTIEGGIVANNREQFLQALDPLLRLDMGEAINSKVDKLETLVKNAPAYPEGGGHFNMKRTKEIDNEIEAIQQALVKKLARK